MGKYHFDFRAPIVLVFFFQKPSKQALPKPFGGTERSSSQALPKPFGGTEKSSSQALPRFSGGTEKSSSQSVPKHFGGNERLSSLALSGIQKISNQDVRKPFGGNERSSRQELPRSFSGIPQATNVPYIGLRNQGATCYMNSILQSLFHIPFFRKKIFQIPVNALTPLARDLRRLFTAMQCDRDAVNPYEFTKHFDWIGNVFYKKHIPVADE
jgi:hypothetical protein